MTLEILTHKGLLQLRNILASNPELVFTSLPAIQVHYEIETKRSNYDLGIAQELVIPAKNSVSVADKKDLVNSLTIFKMLEELSPSDANDERLWVTLALREFHPYTVARWAQGLSKTSGKSDLRRLIKNHILIASTRDLWRNQSISRLWWMSYYAKSTTPERYELTLALLLSNSEFVARLLGTPSIATSRNLASAVLAVCLKNFTIENKYSWNRDKFRLFIMKIDLLAGRRLLDALPTSTLEAELDSLFIHCFE